MRRYDLLVLGGGPAGAAMAAMAASSGLSTLVVERAGFPRDKVCGEFLAAEGCAVLDRLGVLGELSVGAPRMDACRITDRGGKRIDIALPSAGKRSGDGLGISRERLDTTLLGLAASRGAEVRQRVEAVSPRFDGDRICGFDVRRVGQAGVEAVDAALVVAADGRRSVLARSLHPHLGDPRRSSGGSWFGLKLHLAGGAARLGRRVELHLFDGGYVGLAPVEGDRINLCGMVTVRVLRECGGSPDRLLAERILANPAVEAVIGGSLPGRRWHSVGPLRFAVRRPAAAGALFLGDAAGTIDPFCGEGMSHALLSAEIALPVVLEAIDGGGLSPALARRYTRQWRRSFAPVTRRVRLLGKLFERPRWSRPLLSLLRGPAAPIASQLISSTRPAVGDGRG